MDTVEVVKASDQVIFRKKMLHGGNQISYGQVISIEGSTALVRFPVDGIRRSIPVQQLEKVSTRIPGVSSVSYVASQRAGFEPYRK